MNMRECVPALALALLVSSLPGCASTSRQEGTGEYVDNSVITARVKAEIVNDPMLKVAEINVETYKGTVQLSGFAGSQSEIDQAAKVASRVEGVKSVKNDLRLK